MFIGLFNIFGSALEFILNNILSLAGGVGTVLMAIVIWMTKKYLVPYLNLESRRRYARFITAIADDVTDDLVRKYPDNRWMKYLDEAVDKVIDICGIDQEIAERAVSAAIARKNA